MARVAARSACSRGAPLPARAKRHAGIERRATSRDTEDPGRAAELRQPLGGREQTEAAGLAAVAVADAYAVVADAQVRRSVLHPDMGLDLAGARVPHDVGERLLEGPVERQRKPRAEIRQVAGVGELDGESRLRRAFVREALQGVAEPELLDRGRLQLEGDVPQLLEARARELRQSGENRLGDGTGCGARAQRFDLALERGEVLAQRA